ncbi:DUF1671-domain-containing protein [Aspergillus pseudotamarii]|uniref:Adenylate kinase isoenzyme 6 homolog n=1 Tax=Aspergillus pseudotamarii TaxID=132259 RepID=A0A5N6SES9_ASPPS|nr:DUF1671-domain-containing protein [Aspergillus pseudotamarii]KAE8132191.1 DUF1671-domain-containing protein [Aspergillus pseudotamarii]
MDPARAEVPTCPFCTFSDPASNSIVEHIELYHPEIDKRFGVSGKKAIKLNNLKVSSDCRQHLSASEENGHLGKYTDCPRGCGEVVMDTELSTHLDLHLTEETTYESTSSQPELTARKLSRPDDYEDLDNTQDLHGPFVKSQLEKERPTQEAVREKRPRSSSNIALTVKKLGRAELGPYAHEKQMPSWLRKLLEKGVRTTESNTIAPDGTLRRHRSIENETTDVVPVLVRLCEQDRSVQRAFFCSPKVHQISKTPKEGGFCGYRNIQMLISYIKECRLPGHESFSEVVPTILQIQEMIEKAWDMGFNSIGRIETGGIRGTRKYIGTPEVRQEHLTSSIGGIKDMQAHDVLFMRIANYFRQACSLGTDDKVFLTNLPPIYFQHQGHSLTIIGFEIRDNGSANLLVLDPMFKPSSTVKRLRGTRAVSADPARILKGYRRGAAYLQKYKVFEILKATMRASPNVIITGTPGVGKTVHCEQLAQDTGLRHLSINQVAKDRDCFESYDEELETWIVDEDKLLDAVEDEMLQGGLLIDWHACDLFPKSWIDLVVVLRCPSTSLLYDRLSSRGYKQAKLQENLDAEIFGVLFEEAREAFDEEVVVELTSEKDDDVEENCRRISSWVSSWIDQNLNTN